MNNIEEKVIEIIREEFFGPNGHRVDTHNVFKQISALFSQPTPTPQEIERMAKQILVENFVNNQSILTNEGRKAVLSSVIDAFTAGLSYRKDSDAVEFAEWIFNQPTSQIQAYFDGQISARELYELFTNQK